MADNEQKARDLIAEAEKKLVAKPFLGNNGTKSSKNFILFETGEKWYMTSVVIIEGALYTL